MKITLNYQEQVIVKEVALARHLTNIDKERKSYKMGNGDDLQINLEGLAGEFAFCKIKNIYPDMSIEKPLAFDCAINHIGFIDVKTTNKPHGMLLVGVWKAKYLKPAYYALMIGEMPTYEFKGFFPGSEVFKPENIVNFGYGDTYGISQERLIMDL
jgi:hypothetical protein